MVILLKDKIKRIVKSEKFKKMKLICLIGLSIILLFAGGFFLTTSLIQLFSSQAEEIKYIEENGMKYISIKDGFIAEELKVEAGELLPNLAEYFNESYKLSNDATVSYYEGEDSLEISDFTYVKNDNTYVRGIKNLTAKITNNNENYESKLVIEDTEKPVVLLQNVTITEGEAVDATKFVAIYVDNSQLLDFNATIVGTDDYSKIGSYELKINVCDMANNCVLNTAMLTIKEKEIVLEEDISSFETGSGEEDGSGETPGGENPGGENPPSTPKPEVVPAPSITKLTLSKGTLSPTFKSSVTSYKATVANSVSSVKVTATAAKGSTFISGYGTRTVNLKVGSNTTYVKVKNSDNKTVAYKIVITRKAAESTSGGGNSGGSGGSTGGGTGSEEPPTPEKERVFIEKRTSSNFPFKMINHYGAKEYFLASTVTYNLYTDNYVEVLSFDGSIWTEWDFSGYKTDVKAMKKEAEEVLAANASTREYFLEKTNATRAANGVAPVTLDYDLSVVATMRTFELTYGNTLSHTRPDGQRFYTILKEYGFKAGYLNGTKHYGENMAYWQNTDASAYTALISSSGHKQNILDSRWKKMGVGTFTFYGRRYWIQLFTT
jgi:uncharacterized protein YkwD